MGVGVGDGTGVGSGMGVGVGDGTGVGSGMGIGVGDGIGAGMDIGVGDWAKSPAWELAKTSVNSSAMNALCLARCRFGWLSRRVCATA
jgi:hypothetical protein